MAVWSSRSIRELIIGVRLKLTTSETRIATAAVTPNEYRNRPEIDDMNDTGRKTTTRLSVVAMTASPMSRVAWTAACIGGIFFSSMKRKMFSSTTMASSMTTPTISTSASIVMLFSVKFSQYIAPKVAMIDAGIATAAMTVARQLRMNSKHHQRGEDRAENQVQLHFVEGRFDVARLVLHDVEPYTRRQKLADTIQPRFDIVDDVDRIGAGLPA